MSQRRGKKATGEITEPNQWPKLTGVVNLIFRATMSLRACTGLRPESGWRNVPPRVLTADAGWVIQLLYLALLVGARGGGVDTFLQRVLNRAGAAPAILLALGSVLTRYSGRNTFRTE